jgi:hypothetical protein
MRMMMTKKTTGEERYLIITYKGMPSQDCREDKAIEGAMNAESVGSGYFFPTQTRDLQFEFENERKAELAKESLMAVKKKLKIKGLRAEVQCV